LGSSQFIYLEILRPLGRLFCTGNDQCVCLVYIYPYSSGGVESVSSTTALPKQATTKPKQTTPNTTKRKPNQPTQNLSKSQALLDAHLSFAAACRSWDRRFGSFCISAPNAECSCVRNAASPAPPPPWWWHFFHMQPPYSRSSFSRREHDGVAHTAQPMNCVVEPVCAFLLQKSALKHPRASTSICMD
jgi:hypothetical protein